jgi:hypothetical protein
MTSIDKLVKSEYALVKAMKMEWSSFAWTSEKEAMYVPVKLEFDKTTYWLQLDTGCKESLVYDVPLRQLTGQTAFQDKYCVLSGEIGNYGFRNERFWIKQHYGEQILSSGKHNEIGTLGLDFFMDKILAIDYPNDRFCICKSLTELPEELVKEIEFTRVRIKFGKLFLEELKFRDKPLRGIFLDTGSSRFTLVLLLKHHWQKLTGKKGNEQDNQYLDVPAWGEKVSIMGAKAKGILKLGDLEIEDPMIYLEPHLPGDGIKYFLMRIGIRIFKVNGIMGNAPFYDKYIVILDLQQNRFGFLKSFNDIPHS